ncbi:TldD/PmbA family protein [bacterium]|nr:TldD/PmbA family protein [candidate division CSSED10-310 bacterium]
MADLTSGTAFESLDPRFEAMVIEEQTDSLATRLAESGIQANTAVRDRQIWFLVFRDGRMGLATGSMATQEATRQMIREATQAWGKSGHSSPRQPPAMIEPPFQPVPDPDVINENPRQRTEQLKTQIDGIRRHDLDLAGAFTSSVVRRRILSTAGADLYAANSLVDLSCTVTAQGHGSGWARQFSTHMNDIDPAALIRRAGGKALQSRNAKPLTRGRMTVILEPAAVGMLLLFLGFLSFGGRGFNRGTSFLSGRLGKKVLPDHVTIWDNSSDPRIFGWPFDYEGVPVQPVILVENGFARGVVYDRETALQGSTLSTGHALAPDNHFGPYPRCLHMRGGDRPVSNLIASLDHAILITRFWYINYVNPMQTMVTGSTRDGTFEIRSGRITRAVSDMRFEESILEAFARSIAVSTETEYVRQFGSTLHVPWMVIPDFNFTEVI